MNLNIPGIRFLHSEIPLEFHTDGITKSIKPTGPGNNALDTLFILSDLQYEFFNLKAVPQIKSCKTLFLPDDIAFPLVFDGSQNLAGKKILLFMLTGWGDTILIEPVIRSFYKKLAAAGPAPEITIAGNWIRNFPYAQAAYIRGLCPNILSLNDLTRFDFIVNFIPAQLIILISFSYRPCGEAVPWPIIFFINNIVFILQLFQNIFYSFLVHIKSQYNLF